MLTLPLSALRWRLCDCTQPWCPEAGSARPHGAVIAGFILRASRAGRRHIRLAPAFVFQNSGRSRLLVGRTVSFSHCLDNTHTAAHACICLNGVIIDA